MEQSDDDVHDHDLEMGDINMDVYDIDHDQDDEENGFPEVDYFQLQHVRGQMQPLRLQDVPSDNSTTMTYTEPFNHNHNNNNNNNTNKKVLMANISKTTSYLDDGVGYNHHINQTETSPNNTARTEIFAQTDIFDFTMDLNELHSSPSIETPTMRGYRTDDTMTPPAINEYSQITSCMVKEFKLSFDDDLKQIISNENEIKTMDKQLKGLFGDSNCVGVGEWTLLSTPKVFDYYDNKENNNINGFGLGLGFIDRTRGVCGVSLAPIYFRYGGILNSEKYYDKLDAYNLYTGDYITCCNKLPFNDLHDTQCSIVRDGYKSTLVITGGQYYGREIYDDSLIQKDTYFYAPWVNSNYHHQITENYDGFDKHGIITPTVLNNDEKRLITKNFIIKREYHDNLYIMALSLNRQQQTLMVINELYHIIITHQHQLLWMIHLL